MDSVRPGRLRPWLRFHTPFGLLEARPDGFLSISDWSDFLWESYVRGGHKLLCTAVTAIHKLPEPCWPMAKANSCHLSKSQLLELGKCQPLAAALLWGQNRPFSPNPWPAWKRWAALARRRIFPLGLLWCMAFEECQDELAMPGYQTESWLSGLTVCAANWLGAEAGVAVWNSLAVGGSETYQKLRWKLAFETGLKLEPGLREEELTRLLEVLTQARPEHLPHWRWLLESEANSFDLARIWKQPLSQDELFCVTLDMKDGLREIVDEAPEKLPEFLRRDLKCPGLDEMQLVNLFVSCPDWELRLLLLACLHELHEAHEPSRDLLNLAQELGCGRDLLAAAACWQAADLNSSLAIPGISSQRLARVEHWRRLSGRAHAWPKTLRRWLEREANPRSQEHQLRQLLKLQQNFDRLEMQAGAQAWQALLAPICQSLLSQFCGLPVPQERLESGWLVGCPDVKPELLAALFKPESRPNQDWLESCAIDLTCWLQGLEEKLLFDKVEYRVHTADRWESLQMGSDFNTCLTLRNGIYRGSALVNSLDANKHVLYLRAPSGQPVLRQMLAVTSQGGLHRYPAYSREIPAELRRAWAARLDEFAVRCGLGWASSQQTVEQIHPYDSYYCDSPEQEEANERDELDFLARPERPDCASQWALARHLASILNGNVPRHCCLFRVAGALGALGETRWLDGWGRRRLPQEYLTELNYQADCKPLVEYFRRGGRGPYRAVAPPAALVSLNFADLCRVLKGLRIRAGLPALSLLLICWRRRPDPKAYWRYLRGGFSMLSMLPQVIPNFPHHLRQAQPPRQDLPMDESDRRQLERLWRGELRDWVFGGDQQEWALDVLARLRLEGDLHMDGPILADWMLTARCRGWAWRDLDGAWGELKPLWVAVALIRDPEGSRAYLEGLPTAARMEMIIELVWLVSPNIWEQLSSWVPAQVPSSFQWSWARNQARRSERVRLWLQRLEPKC